MKIGVAFSGCDVGGVYAWRVLREFAAMGLDIGMISACCIPATTSLLYAYGCDETVMQKLTEAFLHDFSESDVDFAIANFSAAFKPGDGAKIPLAINAVDLTDGKIITFTDDYTLESGDCKTLSPGDPYDMLSATISLMDGLGSYAYESCKLCDFCSWYGCPVHPIKLAGLDKVISVAFLPKLPKTPYEALVKRMIASSTVCADVHISIEFDESGLEPARYEQTVLRELKNSEDEVLYKMLF